MANSPVDRDSSYMKTAWGTSHLITDYSSDDKVVIQEVMYDSEIKLNRALKHDLFETPNNDEDEFEYGVEPTYKIQKNQKLLRE